MRIEHSSTNAFDLSDSLVGEERQQCECKTTHRVRLQSKGNAQSSPNHRGRHANFDTRLAECKATARSNCFGKMTTDENGETGDTVERVKRRKQYKLK